MELPEDEPLELELEPPEEEDEPPEDEDEDEDELEPPEEDELDVEPLEEEPPGKSGSNGSPGSVGSQLTHGGVVPRGGPAAIPNCATATDVRIRPKAAERAKVESFMRLALCV